jgi:hypothetical protein
MANDSEICLAALQRSGPTATIVQLGEDRNHE